MFERLTAGRALLLAFSLLAMLPLSALHAAEPTQVQPRPRIGLVLSGGGARGVAHVGVLKVLDDLQIPVDAIAGTSMGAVVGGLYATGLTAREIEALMSTVNWQDSFRDRPPRFDLNFRRKREDQDFLVQLPLGLRGGRFLLPKGLIQGQKLTQILRGLTANVADVADFDRLPTPFRAVATDLESGEPVVLTKGDLTTAIRASMSAPGVFAPVEYQGRVLVDGGISQNLPVEVARQMGVDILIVVDVGFPLAERGRLGSVASISNQMLAILIRRDSVRQRATLGAGDIVIDPALGDISSFDFSRVTRSIGIGEKAARESATRLAALSLRGEAWERYVQARRHPGHESATVAFVRTDEGSRRYAATVQEVFGDLVGRKLDSEDLSRRINGYYGQGILESLDYTFVDEGDARGLLFHARRNSWGPNYVRFGLSLQDDFEGNSSFDAAARFVLTELNSRGAEWTWDLQVGQTPRIATELYLPLSYRQRYFLAPHAEFELRNVPQIENERQVGEFRVRTTQYGLDLGREFGNASELRTGVLAESGTSRLRLGEVTGNVDRFRDTASFARFSFDTLDSVSFPRRGQAMRIEWRAVLDTDISEEVSDELSFDWRFAHSWGRNTAVLWASAGTLFDSERASPRSYYPLGGFLNLSGVAPDALIGTHYAISRLIYLRQVGRGGEGFLNVPLYAGMSFELGDTWGLQNQRRWDGGRKDLSVFFGADTFIGPAYLGMGYDDRGRSAFYLFLGRSY